ncbi:Hypothetical predicted protein [Octopus vulgaris]|uniref:Uncharacterized protein n=1 Tax=Octopus vulgaris TaxID=6645 RepID=A0AA36FLN0_OCTVU|nr:Hypothetical predicted protein [Octopus vulgaris]
MQRAIAKLEFSEDEDNGEIIDVAGDFSQWERTHALRYPMPKDTLWGSELILGTILDSSKNPATLDHLRFFPPSKPLHGKAAAAAPPPAPPPSPATRRPSLLQRSPPGAPKMTEEQFRANMLKEMELRMLDTSDQDGRISYGNNLTEGTFFDIVEKPVRTTVDNFQHEWTVSVNDYSTVRLRKLKQDLKMNDDCSDLTTGTYLEAMLTSKGDSEQKKIWRDPIQPGSRTQSDISFHEESK